MILTNRPMTAMPVPLEREIKVQLMLSAVPEAITRNVVHDAMGVAVASGKPKLGQLCVCAKNSPNIKTTHITQMSATSGIPLELPKANPDTLVEINLAKTIEAQRNKVALFAFAQK